MAGAPTDGTRTAPWRYRVAVAGGTAGSAGDDGLGQYLRERSHAGGGALDGVAKTMAARSDDRRFVGGYSVRLRSFAQDSRSAAPGEMVAADRAPIIIPGKDQPAVAQDRPNHQSRDPGRHHPGIGAAPSEPERRRISRAA